MAAINSAASELDTCCSADPSMTHGIAISIDREGSQPTPAGEDGTKVDTEERDRQQDHHRDRRPGKHERGGADLLDGDSDQQVRDTPDDRHEAEEHDAPSRHAETPRRAVTLRWSHGVGEKRPQAYHRRRMSDFLGDTRDLLRRTPEVLRALLTGLPDTWTATPDVAEGWRPS